MDIEEISKTLVLELAKAMKTNSKERILVLNDISIDDIKSFIRSFHAIIWREYVILNEEDLEKAATRFKLQMENLYDFLRIQTS